MPLHRAKEAVQHPLCAVCKTVLDTLVGMAEGKACDKIVLESGAEIEAECETEAAANDEDGFGEALALACTTLPSLMKTSCEAALEEGSSDWTEKFKTLVCDTSIKKLADIEIC